MAGNNRQNPSSDTQQGQQNKITQGVPVTPGQKQAAQGIQQQIEQFEKQLEGKSNSELKTIATQLESVEREVLLEKIDQQLQTVKETVVKPGDAAADTAAAGAATVVLNETPG